MYRTPTSSDENTKMPPQMYQYVRKPAGFLSVRAPPIVRDIIEPILMELLIAACANDRYLRGMTSEATAWRSGCGPNATPPRANPTMAICIELALATMMEPMKPMNEGITMNHFRPLVEG